MILNSVPRRGGNVSNIIFALTVLVQHGLSLESELVIAGHLDFVAVDLRVATQVFSGCFVRISVDHICLQLLLLREGAWKKMNLRLLVT